MSPVGVLNPKSVMFITIHQNDDKKNPNKVSCKDCLFVSSVAEKYPVYPLHKCTTTMHFTFSCWTKSLEVF